jgi:AraC-like DNA-binding protein
MLSLEYFSPSAKLAPYVKCYYRVAGYLEPGQHLQDHLVPNMATLRFELAGGWNYRWADSAWKAFPKSALIGPTSQPLAVETRGPFLLFGVDLTPRGQALVWDGTAADIADKCVELTWLSGGIFLQLFGQLSIAGDDAGRVATADTFLLGRLEQMKKPKTDLYAAIDAHLAKADDENVTVAGIAHALDVSERQLERWTAKLYGFRPKLILRRARFMRVLEAILSNPNAMWQDVAGASYFDQSHFCRDFKLFCGLTPGKFFQRHRSLIRSNTTSISRDSAHVPINGYVYAGSQIAGVARPDRYRPRAVSRLHPIIVPRSTLDFLSAN